MRSLGLALLVVLALAAPAAADPVVVTHDDQVQPRAGRDYSRLMSVHLGDATEATYVTAGGKIVLSHYSESGPMTLRLLDPETGRSTTLPAPGKFPRIVEMTADTIWYSDTARVSGQTTVYRYDRQHRRMRHFLLPDVAKRESYDNRVIGIEGRTIWYTSGQKQEHNDENVWSVRFGKAGTVTSEGRRLGMPVVADGVLAWSEYGLGDDPSYLAMRDLATGEVTRAEIPDACSPEPSRIQSNGSQFVQDVVCDDPEGETIVVDRSGEVTTILRVESDEGSIGTSDRGIFFFWDFYDLASGKLWDISDKRYAEGSPVSGPGTHPVQVWPQRDGQALVVRLK